MTPCTSSRRPWPLWGSSAIVGASRPSRAQELTPARARRSARMASARLASRKYLRTRCSMLTRSC
eukprot:8872273-Alexandrium_andersonii.AAC.1